MDCNLKSVDFLDVTLDLSNNVYQPYRKPNNKPIYINKHSNHPPNILKQLPNSIAKRISETSSNKDIFDKSITVYQNALSESGFDDVLEFIKPENSVDEDKHKRKRKIIWFNPPYSKSVKTNIGKTFLQLLSKHFPPNNKMHKIFNENTVKISYSCMRNISSIISSHNRNILYPKPKTFGCNCRNKNDCPLNGECLTPKVIYRADIISNNESKFYIGLSETTFKEHFRNHNKDFKYAKYENSTELAKYVWSLKNSNDNYTINWKILSKVYSNANNNACHLCLTEKLMIIEAINDNGILNKKSEFVSKCRHINKFLLKNVKRSGVT